MRGQINTITREELENLLQSRDQRIADLEGYLQAHGVQLNRIRTFSEDNATTESNLGEQVVEEPTSSGAEWAKGRWCVTGLTSSATFSNSDSTLWEGQFDSSANQSYRVYKGALTAFGELNPHYDGSDLHVRHRLLFVNKKGAFQAKMHLRLFSGTIGALVTNRVVMKLNGAMTTISAEGYFNVSIRQGTNNLAFMHYSGRVIDIWGQFLDGKNVYALQVDCGVIKAGAEGGGGGGRGAGGTE